MRRAGRRGGQLGAAGARSKQQQVRGGCGRGARAARPGGRACGLGARAGQGCALRALGLFLARFDLVFFMGQIFGHCS